jgi:methyl coenzyme M reductase subunit C-like uncharacterized protein (methanogenesis marker protein 7)
MVRLLSCAVAGTLCCGLLAGCGKQAPKAAPKAKPGTATTMLTPPPPEVKPPAPKTAAESDPLLARLGLSAEQLKKVNDLIAEYSKKSAALPDSASNAEFKAVLEERNKKVREALTPEQQTKYDAGLKVMADYDAKVTKLQQTNYAAMMAVPKDQIDKRREVRDDYKQKRAVIDAEGTKALDEAIGKGPALSADSR